MSLALALKVIAHKVIENLEGSLSHICCCASQRQLRQEALPSVPVHSSPLAQCYVVKACRNNSLVRNFHSSLKTDSSTA